MKKDTKIILTNQAIKNIQRLQKEYDSAGCGLRFGLSGGGCSGYRYVIEFEKDPGPGDTILDFNGIKVFINSDHIEKLKGSTIGWKESLMESGFDIDNPQAKRSCGCGESIDF